MPDDGSILYLGMTETLLTETGLTPEYWIKEIQKNSDGARLKAGCFAKCREMEKGKGRGACKAECWLDVAVKVATVVAVVAAL